MSVLKLVATYWSASYFLAALLSKCTLSSLRTKAMNQKCVTCIHIFMLTEAPWWLRVVLVQWNLRKYDIKVNNLREQKKTSYPVCPYPNYGSVSPNILLLKCMQY